MLRILVEKLCDLLCLCCMPLDP